MGGAKEFKGRQKKMTHFLRSKISGDFEKINLGEREEEDDDVKNSVMFLVLICVPQKARPAFII